MRSPGTRALGSVRCPSEADVPLRLSLPSVSTAPVLIGEIHRPIERGPYVIVRRDAADPQRSVGSCLKAPRQYIDTLTPSTPYPSGLPIHTEPHGRPRRHHPWPVPPIYITHLARHDSVITEVGDSRCPPAAKIIFGAELQQVVGRTQIPRP
jgi:hypothetical protein